MAKWQTNIPGTEVDRVEVIERLVAIRDDEARSFPLYRNAYIHEVAQWGVLSAPQIAELVGCGSQTVKRVLGGSPTGHRGSLPPGALDLLLLAARRLAAGGQPYPADLETLARNVSPILLTKLLGFSQPTYWRAAHRKNED